MQKYKLFIVEDNDEQLKILQDNIKILCLKIEFSEILYADSYLVAVEILKSGKVFDFSILDIYLDEGRTCYELIRNFGVAQFGKPIFNTVEEEILSMHLNLNIFSEGNRSTKPFFVLKNKYSQSSIEMLSNELVKYINAQRNVSTISFKVKNLEKIIIKKEDIVYIQTLKDRDNYCGVYYIAIGGIKMLEQKKTLKYFEEILDEKYFVRIHNQTILNIAPEYIEKISDETVILKFKDNVNRNILLPISEKYKENLNARLG